MAWDPCRQGGFLLHSKATLVCILCPRGCRGVVEEGGERVEGYGCQLGFHYAMQELRSARRLLTTTVSVKGGSRQRLPVMSRARLPLHLFPACIKQLSGVRVIAPLKQGDIIVKNIQDTGVDVVASRSMPRATNSANRGY